MPRNKAMLMAIAVVLLAFFTAPSHIVYADNSYSALWCEPEEADPIVAVPAEAELLEAINNNLLPEAQVHPYIHAKKSKLCEIKSNLQSGDEYTKIFYDKIKSDADVLLNTKVVANYGAVNQGHYHVQSRILNLMITYFIEGDGKYLDRALLEFYELKKIEKWTADSYLDCTATAAAIAICYDWLYDYLTDEEKDWCITSIKEKCLDLAYEYYKYPSRLNAIMQANDNMYMVLGESSYNQATCNNSNLLVAALAVAPQYPEYAAYIIYKNLYNIRLFFYEVGAGGGLDEPIAYFNYKGVKSINMLSAINGAFGTVYGYGVAEGFRTMAYYPIFMYGAGPFAFGDTSPKAASFDTNSLYFVAKQAKNKELLGLIKEKLPEGDCALPILWYEKGEMANALQNASLPLDKHLYPTYKTLNVAVFRNCWDLENGFFAGLYAGVAGAAHNSAVSGAFCIDAWGERFITPIAKGSYTYPGYFDTAEDGERWAWYETRAEGNCCLVINPSEDAGQDITKTAVIDNFESSFGSAYAISDLSGVYKDYVSAYKRGLSTENDRSKIVLQDEAKMLSPSKIHWSINCAADAEIIDNNTVLLSVGEKLLAMKIYTNVDFTLGIMASEKLSTSPIRDGQLSYPDYRKIFFDAENVSELYVRAEFIPITSKEQIPNEVPKFVPMNEWTDGNAVIPEPMLGKICINGENIDGFEKNIYNYDIGSENGEITFTAEGGCTAVLLNKNSFTAEISVNEGIRKSLYTLTFWGSEPQYQNDLISKAQFVQDKNECKMRALIKDKPPENTKAILAAFSKGALCCIKIIELENFSGKQISADFSNNVPIDSAKAFLVNKFDILTPVTN